MIHYQLNCAAGHEFDGWFAGSAAFEQQAEAGLITCPHCAGTSVTRALMAPAIPRKGGAVTPVAISEPVPAKQVSGAMPDAVRAALTKLRQAIETHCDYVGLDFAEEARRIHQGDAEPRSIYGETSREEAEALADEGIEFARIPWVPPTDS
jgi:hypothetical protein